MKTVRSFGAPSVQHDGTNGDLILTVYPHDLIPSGDIDRLQPAVIIRVPVVEIASFIAQVVSSGGYALHDAITNAMLGDCKTCSNTRMVTEEVKGRSMRVHCPDCNPEDEPEKHLPMVRKPGFRKDEIEGPEF